MRILLAAGGTAGHVNPALAIAEGLQQRYPDAEIHFAGRSSGMERRLVEQAGYPFHHIEVRGIQRSLSLRSVARNMAALWHLAFAPRASRKILEEIAPDLVIGAGGYVSGPVVQKAAHMGIKTAIHEQNAWPGMTNKLLAKQVDLVFAPTESAVERLGVPEKTKVVGNPVRQIFFEQDRDAARKSIGAKQRVVILSYGGSLGAMKVNLLVAQLAAWHLKCCDFLHIHATGSIEKEDFTAMVRRMGLTGFENFRVVEYIDDMPSMLAASDLVICRSGALTLAELAAVGRASVLIPSPNVAENHQYHNAMEFANKGAAVVFQEKDLTAKGLIETVDELTKEPARLEEMGRAAKELARPQAVADIVEALSQLLEQ